MYLASFAKRIAAGLLALTFCAAIAVPAQAAPFTVNADVALASLISLADGHLQTLSDALQTFAATPAARSGNWTRIAAGLHALKVSNVPATLLYAAPDGHYWTLTGGLQQRTIADRDYFKAAMAGRISIGDLVVGRSTGRPVAVIAIPVKGFDGKVSGVVGAGVLLNRLSRLLTSEMDLGKNDVFWALDPHGTIALHSDVSPIFVKPGTLSPALAKVTTTMLARHSGTQTYEFRGRMRTIVFRRSAYSGWTFGFGVVH